MDWCSVDEDFMDYLRNCEPRIPKTDYGADKYKPFYGVLFEINDLAYVTQISSPKPRHERMKNSLDFIKLYDNGDLLAVVNLNYMFPTQKDRFSIVSYSNIESFRSFADDNEKNAYIGLLKKEKNEILKSNILAKAQKLYTFKYDFPDNNISQRCLDFKDLEEKCKSYNAL